MPGRPGTIDPSALIAACGPAAIGQGVFLEILGHFIRQNVDRMDDLLRAAEQADRPRLAHLAHAIKGSASMVGATHLSGLAYQLELDAAAAPPAVVARGVTSVQSEFAALLATLRAEYPKAFE
jgi:HPt (histidine-containing phosphotransfer) domain-containing protein